MSFQETMKALSDPTRREILDMLKKRSMSASDIADKFDITNASISHHLSILKKANLIIDDKRGKYIYYEINTTMVEEVLKWVTQLRE